MNADDLLAQQPQKTAREKAEDFLLDALDRGAVEVKKLKEMAANRGLSWRTVERAKGSVEAGARKRDFDDGWEWFIEDRQPEENQ